MDRDRVGAAIAHVGQTMVLVCADSVQQPVAAAVWRETRRAAFREIL
jgi:hypothetical protein